MDALWNRVFGAKSENGAGAERMRQADPLSGTNVASPEDLKRLEKARKQESIKKNLSDIMTRLKKQEVDLIAKYEAQRRIITTCTRQQNRQGAVSAIKMRNLYESQIRKIQSEQLAIENQLLHLESTEITQDAARALKEANLHLREAQKQKNGGIQMEDVQELMADVSETQVQQEMISEMMSMAVDDTQEDAEEEYEQFLRSAAAAESSSSGIRLPSAPCTDSDDEKRAPTTYKSLEKIQAEMW
jgi:hypothetical protein